MPTQTLTTATAVIDALGGTTAVAKLAGKTPQSVTNWRAANRLPAATFLVLSAALKKQEQEAPSALWGICEAPKRQERAAS